MKVSARHQAREFAVQGLYSWQLSKNDVAQIELSIATSNNMEKVDVTYFQELLRGVVGQVDEIDEKMRPYLGRLPEELDPIEKAIIRVAGYELLHRVEIPFRVVINEAIELAKTFGAEESHKFVNGALDKAVKTLRKHES